MLELLGDDSLPSFTASCTYALLAITHGSYLLKKQNGGLSNAWWKYALLAGVDVLAAYFTLLALRYTSVTSWSLIQPSSLLTVVPLSIVCLQASYSWKHGLSGALAFSGLVVLLLSDIEGNDSDHHGARNTIAGDLSVLLGASLYGLNSVMVEWVVKSGVPQYEVLALLGAFGCLFSGIFALMLGEISTHMFRSATVVVLTLVTACVNYGFYALAVFVFKDAGAAVLDLSLLAGNFWSVLGKLLIVGNFHTNIVGFVFAVIMIISGVVLFSLSGDPYAKVSLTYIPIETELAITTEDTASRSIRTDTHSRN